MALMTRMRDQMHFVLWAILILFLLSMSIGGLVGGANIIDQLMGKVDPRKAIGMVNGETISPDVFMRMVSAELEQYRTQGAEITEQQIATARERVWDQLVTEILIREQVDNFGFSATNEEIIFHLYENPPAFLTNQEAFQTNGQFDPKKYSQALDNPQGNEWAGIEDYLRTSVIPNLKLEQVINSAVHVSEMDLRNEFIKRNIDYTIDGIHAIASKFKDDDLEPAEQEIKKYYRANADEFEQDEQRHLRYVSWAKVPSQADTLRAYGDAMTVLDEARQGADFARLANQFTEDPGNAITPDSGRGGTLGWFGKDQMVAPFAEAAFAAETGDIVGPVLTRFGYHVIKVNDRRTTDDKDEVNAAHILFNIPLGNATRDELRREATLFSYDATDYGFAAALDSHQIQASPAANITENSIFIPGLGQFRSAARFAFNEALEGVSPPLENDQHYAVFVIDSITPAGIQSLEQVQGTISSQLKQDNQSHRALEKISLLADEFTRSDDLQTLADEHPELDVITGDTRSLSRGFTSIGRSNYLVGALLEAHPGAVIGPVETPRGYALVQVKSVADFDSTEFYAQQDVIRNELTSRRQSQLYTDWIGKLKDDAEIVDNRKYYF